MGPGPGPQKGACVMWMPGVNHDDKYSIGFALDRIGIPKIINQNMIYLMISDNLIIPKKDLDDAI